MVRPLFVSDFGEKRAEMHMMLNDMLNNLILPSKSPWAAPIF